jgi:biotin carboxyl carrier protein
MEEKKDLKVLKIEDTEYKTTLTSKFENRKVWKEADPKEVHSYIPGSIVSIEVKEGQAVKNGELLLVLEAMKMNNKVVSAIDGKIKKIYVEVGQKLPKGTLLIEFA